MQETRVGSPIQEDHTRHRELSLCVTTTEPVPSSWGPRLLKPVRPKICALQQKKSPQEEAHAPQLECSPRSPQLEKS